MADWKISKEIAEVKQHANADALDIVKLGTYQLVSGKGNYQTGDVVILIPEKSVLTNGDMIKEYEKYLSGPKHDRVKAVQLRGEISQGITWPMDNLEAVFGGRIADLIEAAPIGEDISELMGITKYEAPIPANMAGDVERVSENVQIIKHDVLQFGAYASEIDPEERVVITEKLHGTQLNYTVTYDPDLHEYTETVTSKGFASRDLALKEDARNLYWQAVRNSDLREKVIQLIKSYYNPSEEVSVTVHGEVIPAQGGFTYGQVKPIVKVFNVVMTEGAQPWEKWEMPYLSILSLRVIPGLMVSEHPEKNVLRLNTLFDWVPVLYDGPLKGADVYAFAKGKETVSGKELHIREGIVVQPFTPRRAADGQKLKLKVINPKYKETGEEFN